MSSIHDQWYLNLSNCPRCPQSVEVVKFVHEEKKRGNYNHQDDECLLPSTLENIMTVIRIYQENQGDVALSMTLADFLYNPKSSFYDEFLPDVATILRKFEYGRNNLGVDCLLYKQDNDNGNIFKEANGDNPTSKRNDLFPPRRRIKVASAYDVGLIIYATRAEMMDDDNLESFIHAVKEKIRKGCYRYNEGCIFRIVTWVAASDLLHDSEMKPTMQEAVIDTVTAGTPTGTTSNVEFGALTEVTPQNNDKTNGNKPCTPSTTTTTQTTTTESSKDDDNSSCAIIDTESCEKNHDRAIKPISSTNRQPTPELTLEEMADSVWAGDSVWSHIV